MMGRGQQRRPLRHTGTEGLVAQLAGGHLHGHARRGRARAHIGAMHMHFGARRPAVGHDQLTVGIALRAAQAVVHMHHVAGVAQLTQHMPQHHAVHAAAHGHPERGALGQGRVPPQGMAHAVDHGPMASITDRAFTSHSSHSCTGSERAVSALPVLSAVRPVPAWCSRVRITTLRSPVPSGAK